MKKTFTFCLLVLLNLGAIAQDKAVEQIFQKYSGRDGFTTVVITKNMFQLFADVEDAGDDFLKTVKNLDFIKILSCEAGINGKEFYREILASIPEKDYKELMVIQESGQDIKFLTREKEGVINELIMVAGGKEESALIWITGIIDMKTIGKIAGGMHIEGIENLDKTDQK
jgi:hypothetical protein